LLKALSRTIPFLNTSKGRLAIDYEMFKDMMASLRVNRKFNGFATHFRLKLTENDFAHPPCVFFPLAIGEINDISQGHGECQLNF
jgi:hypothetical protein